MKGKCVHMLAVLLFSTLDIASFRRRFSNFVKHPRMRIALCHLQHTKVEVSCPCASSLRACLLSRAPEPFCFQAAGFLRALWHWCPAESGQDGSRHHPNGNGHCGCGASR